MLQMTWLPRSSFTSQPPESVLRIVNRRVSPPCSRARAYIDDLYPATPWWRCKFGVTVGANALFSLGLLGEETKSASPSPRLPDGPRRSGRRRLFETEADAELPATQRPAHRDPA